MAKKKKKSEYTRVFQACRREWARHNVERKECFEEKKIVQGGFPRWECKKCKQFFAASEIDCDHISPISNTIPKNLDELIVCLKRLFCPKENLQLLCKSCHKEKTKADGHNKKIAVYHAAISDYFEKIGVDNFSLLKLHPEVLKKMYGYIQKIIANEFNKKEELYRVKLAGLMGTYDVR